MNYHLHREGQDQGSFPLKELRQRRQDGELTGAELVWCEGMTQWQPLDAVLHHEAPGSVQTPPPLPIQKPRKVPVALIATVTVAVIALVVVFGYLALRAVRRFQPILEAVSETSTGSGRYGRESALALASKPVHWTTNTITIKQFLNREKEFRLRQYVEGYEKASEHNPAYDAEARQFIKTWIDFSFGGQVQTDNTVFVEACEKLAANPACDDPLILTVIGGNTKEMQEAARRLERAVRGYEHSRYKAYPRLCAQVSLAGKQVDLHRDEGRVRALDNSSVQLLKESFQDGSIRPEDQPELAEVFIHGWGYGLLERNAAAVISTVKAAGKPYEWLALVFEGQSQINKAWKARGDDYADKVSSGGWRIFHEHLALARQSLTQAWHLRPDLVEAPYRMMYVALGDSSLEEMRLWFDRVVEGQIDHFGAWEEMRWGLRPRWHGDLDSMLAFGIMAANTHRYDTDVPRKLFDSVSDLEAELKVPLGHHIYGREDIWPHVQQMYEGYITEPSQAKRRDGWRGALCVAAFLAGKYDVARTELEELNWQLWRTNLTGWGRDLSLISLEVAARTSPVRQQIDAAESRRNAGDFSGALQLYTELSTATNTDERTQAFIRDRLATVGMEQRLQTGEWIDFLPSGENLAGWTVGRGKCTPLPDGTLEVQSDLGGHIVFSRARTGADFEVRGTFEVIRSSTKSFQAGLVMGMPEFGSSDWCGFRMKRNPDEGDVVSFAQGWTTRQLRNPVTFNSETNSFYFRFHRGVVTATVNDKEVFKDAEPPEYVTVPTSESHVGLGAFNDTNNTVIRYHNVQIRKLSSR